MSWVDRWVGRILSPVSEKNDEDDGDCVDLECDNEVNSIEIDDDGQAYDDFSENNLDAGVEFFKASSEDVENTQAKSSVAVCWIRTLSSSTTNQPITKLYGDSSQLSAGKSSVCAEVLRLPTLGDSRDSGQRVITPKCSKALEPLRVKCNLTEGEDINLSQKSAGKRLDDRVAASPTVVGPSSGQTSEKSRVVGSHKISTVLEPIRILISQNSTAEENEPTPIEQEVVRNTGIPDFIFPYLFNYKPGKFEIVLANNKNKSSITMVPRRSPLACLQSLVSATGQDSVPVSQKAATTAPASQITQSSAVREICSSEEFPDTWGTPTAEPYKVPSFGSPGPPLSSEFVDERQSDEHYIESPPSEPLPSHPGTQSVSHAESSVGEPPSANLAMGSFPETSDEELLEYLNNLSAPESPKAGTSMPTADHPPPAQPVDTIHEPPVPTVASPEDDVENVSTKLALAFTTAASFAEEPAGSQLAGKEETSDLSEAETTRRSLNELYVAELSTTEPPAVSPPVERTPDSPPCAPSPPCSWGSESVDFLISQKAVSAVAKDDLDMSAFPSVDSHLSTPAPADVDHSGQPPASAMLDRLHSPPAPGDHPLRSLSCDTVVYEVPLHVTSVDRPLRSFDLSNAGHFQQSEPASANNGDVSAPTTITLKSDLLSSAPANRDQPILLAASTTCSEPKPNPSEMAEEKGGHVLSAEEVDDNHYVISSTPKTPVRRRRVHPRNVSLPNPPRLESKVAAADRHHDEMEKRQADVTVDGDAHHAALTSRPAVASNETSYVVTSILSLAAGNPSATVSEDLDNVSAQSTRKFRAPKKRLLSVSCTTDCLLQSDEDGVSSVDRRATLESRAAGLSTRESICSASSTSRPATSSVDYSFARPRASSLGGCKATIPSSAGERSLIQSLMETPQSRSSKKVFLLPTNRTTDCLRSDDRDSSPLKPGRGSRRTSKSTNGSVTDLASGDAAVGERGHGDSKFNERRTGNTPTNREAEESDCGRRITRSLTRSILSNITHTTVISEVTSEIANNGGTQRSTQHRKRVMSDDRSAVVTQNVEMLENVETNNGATCQSAVTVVEPTIKRARVSSPPPRKSSKFEKRSRLRYSPKAVRPPSTKSISKKVPPSKTLSANLSNRSPRESDVEPETSSHSSPPRRRTRLGKKSNPKIPPPNVVSSPQRSLALDRRVSFSYRKQTIIDQRMQLARLTENARETMERLNNLSPREPSAQHQLKVRLHKFASNRSTETALQRDLIEDTSSSEGLFKVKSAKRTPKKAQSKRKPRTLASRSSDKTCPAMFKKDAASRPSRIERSETNGNDTEKKISFSNRQLPTKPGEKTEHHGSRSTKECLQSTELSSCLQPEDSSWPIASMDQTGSPQIVNRESTASVLKDAWNSHCATLTKMNDKLVQRSAKQVMQLTSSNPGVNTTSENLQKQIERVFEKLKISQKKLMSWHFKIADVITLQLHQGDSSSGL